MGELSKWLDKVNVFIDEVVCLTTEAGADGQVPARDLAKALAKLDQAGGGSLSERDSVLVSRMLENLPAPNTKLQSAIAAMPARAKALAVVDPRIEMSQGEWLSAETVSQANYWKRDGRIFSVSHEGKEYFPRYEFDALYQPLPVIQDILQVFGPVDPWKIAAWFHFPNGWIVEPGPEGPKPVAPKDALDRREDLLNAVKKRHGSYTA